MNNELETLKLGIMSLVMSIPLTEKQARYIKLEDAKEETKKLNKKELNTLVIFEKVKDSESTAGNFGFCFFFIFV